MHPVGVRVESPYLVSDLERVDIFPREGAPLES